MPPIKLSERASIAACGEYAFELLQKGDNDIVTAYESLPVEHQDKAIIRVIEKCRDMVTNGFIILTDHNGTPHPFPISRVERLPDAPKFGLEITRAPIKHGRIDDWPSWI